MFEPWQTAPAVDDMPYEKSFPMQDQPSFPPDTGAATTGAYYDGAADPNYANYGQFDASGSPYPQFPYSDGAVAGGMAGAGAGGMAGAGAGAAYAGYNADGTPAGEVPHGQQPLMDNGAGAAGVGAAAVGGAAAAGAAGAAAAGGNQRQSMVGVPAPAGLHDNMQVNVKVGFVRSLEDELGELDHSTNEDFR